MTSLDHQPLTGPGDNALASAVVLGEQWGWIDTAFFAAVVLAAVIYLYRKFRHRSGACSSCPGSGSCGKAGSVLRETVTVKDH